MRSTAVCVLVMLAVVVKTRAASIKYPIQPVNNSRSMIPQQWNTKDAEGNTHFGYAYDGQAATNVLNADGHMVGAWSYLNPQGALVQTSYTADEKGFNVVVNSLMSERSCYTMEGKLGSCMSLQLCYPTSKLRRLSHLETWTVMTRAACNYFERDGTQIHGVCCSIQQSSDQSGGLSHTARMPFIPSIVVLSDFHNPTVASPLMMWANATQWMITQYSSSSTQQIEVVPENTEPVCGASSSKVLGLNYDRIVGGEEAVPNSWPGIVALKRWGQFNCGGCLISTNKVLTAAHCIEYPVPWNVGQYTVELGAHVMHPTSDAKLSRKVSRVEIHKDYFTLTPFTNDIAILTLNSPVTYSKEVSPFSLPPADTTDDFAGQEAVVIGWGNLFPSPLLPKALQQATIKIVGNDECRKPFASSGITIPNSQMCACSFLKNACRGDSGGPLLVRSSPIAPWIVVGLTSWDLRGCGDIEYPSIYTRVSSYSEWISERM